MNQQERFFNRELSWLAFNDRVFQLGKDNQLPLLERVKFLSIAASNMDEFIKVRMGGLTILEESRPDKRDPSGLNATEQIKLCAAEIQFFFNSLYEYYAGTLSKQLQMSEIVHVEHEKIKEDERLFYGNYFKEHVLPHLVPVLMQHRHRSTIIRDGDIHLFVCLKNNLTGDRSNVVVTIGKNMPRFVASKNKKDSFRYLLMEEVIRMNIEILFEGVEILETGFFRVLRNADIQVSEDFPDSFLPEMEQVLSERAKSEVIALFFQHGMSEQMEKHVRSLFKTKECMVFRQNGPIKFSSFSDLSFMSGFDSLKRDQWEPVITDMFAKKRDIFPILAKDSFLLYHPFESYNPILRFIEEAADDPYVIAIRQVLYRTSKKSPIVEALKRAAQKGKTVTVLVELKARFDESQNIAQAQDMEKAGINVIYGVKGLKTHAKMCAVLRQESSGLKRYLHFGTGNYNEKTARLYCDFSYFTADEDLGSDAFSFFNVVTGYSFPNSFKALDAAPITMKTRFLELIENERNAASEGRQTFVFAKVNSLNHPEVIESLYDASNAGVQIFLNVRGICTLKPGIIGLSENIHVISIVDRYLEHARVFWFCNNGDDKLFISSADWMTRNLDKRLELLVPVREKNNKKKLMRILESFFKDNCNSWKLQPDGTYLPTKHSGSEDRFNAQQFCYNFALQQELSDEGNLFEPYR